MSIQAPSSNASGKRIRRGSIVSAPLSFVALICAILLGFAGWHEWTMREAVLHDASREAANLARSLTQHADDTFEMTDAILTGLIERLETRGQDSVQLEHLSRFMAMRTRTVPRIKALFVYDRNGRWLASSLPSLPAGFNNSDRPYFLHHLNETDRSVYIGAPVLSRSSGEWIVTVSRRFDAPDGSFSGVVLATLATSYFSDLYSRFDVGRHGAIALMHRDGTVMARNPEGGSMPGRNLSSGSLFQKALPVAPSGNLRYVSPVDGRDRLSAYRSSARNPVVIVVAVDIGEVLAAWRADAERRLGGTALLVVIIACVGDRLIRQASLRQRAEAARLESDTNFRLLAENSGDMIARIDLEGRRRYVSPASTKIVGWRPDELVGRDAIEGVHPDDRPELDRNIAALADGRAGEIVLTYRVRHRDGREIWLESSVHATLDPASGKVDGVVATSRDVTERKALELALRSMAMTDGLTGLVNRRRFDEALLAGCSYATNTGSPLTLLMIDVDHFKSFNDRYGHQAGDDCLRKVASTIRDGVRITGAVTARYGGEEMAVLLPRIEMPIALDIAETIRKAVEDLRWKHEGNTASPWVTVSIGLACRCLTPGEDNLDPASLLVREADEALYVAKGSGRNCVSLIAKDEADLDHRPAVHSRRGALPPSGGPGSMLVHCRSELDPFSGPKPMQVLGL